MPKGLIRLRRADTKSPFMFYIAARHPDTHLPVAKFVVEASADEGWVVAADVAGGQNVKLKLPVEIVLLDAAPEEAKEYYRSHPDRLMPDSVELPNTEQTSKSVGSIAGRGFNDPASLTLEEIRSVCASALTQTADRANDDEDPTAELFEPQP